jgi:hypothetical protein
MNQLVWRRVANSTNVIIEKSGHLVSRLISLVKHIVTVNHLDQIAQEAPYELGKSTSSPIRHGLICLC